MKPLHEIQTKILVALANAGGILTVAELKLLYSAKGDGQRVNSLIRNGFADWTRDDRGHNAIGIRITEQGMTVALNAMESKP